MKMSDLPEAKQAIELLEELRRQRGFVETVRLDVIATVGGQTFELYITNPQPIREAALALLDRQIAEIVARLTAIGVEVDG